MGCIEQREKDDYLIQAKETQLQIFLLTIDNIRNGFFFLNSGDSITEEHLKSGYENMQNMASNFLSKYIPDQQQAFEKFIIPFKQLDNTYQYREILSCFYLNSKNKSQQKALAIAELLKKDQDKLNLNDIKEILQRIFRAVFLYSQSLIDNFLVPVEVKNNANNQEKDKQEQEQQQQQEEEKEQEQKLEKEEEKKEVNNQQIEAEQKDNKEEEQKKVEIQKELEQEQQKVFNQNLEIFLQLGENIANNIAESFISEANQTITFEEFSEKCKSDVPSKFKRDIMQPKGIRLIVYDEYDKQKQQQQEQEQKNDQKQE